MTTDPTAFTWAAQVICTKCQQPVAETKGKMIVLGDNLYPLNLHVDASKAMRHECQ